MKICTVRKFNFTKLIGLVLVLFTVVFAGCSANNGIVDNGQKPDDSRFTPVVLAQDLDEPNAFAVMSNGNVVISERKGDLKLYDAALDTTTLIAHINVNTKYTSAEGVVREAEEGLIGVSLDPDFDTNHWIYLYYAHPTEKKHILTRWELVDGKLVDNSEIVMLEVTTQREVCCHTGGGMTWDKDGNLFLTVGNNTGNALSAHTDERPGRASWDDQAHAANTNDLRGKILRIHPEDDGTYTIPEGNLFPEGTEKTRPEIYTMGHRNAWRVAVDSKTGYVYWSEVGPDANEDTEIGPRGYDELNQARGPGNFGWPYFVGPNAAFPYFDYEKNVPLEPKDPNHYTNTSPNNTGLELLPPVAKPFIYYPYGPSEEFPLVGSGSRSATGGPIYHRADFKEDAKRPFPSYYEGKWIATDFSRGWIMAITMKDNGDYESMERFLPSYHPVQPIDMQFGPEGDLYVLEYGSTWFAKSPNSQLVRIEYNAGNRTPIAEASVDKTGGTVPFTAKLSAEGSRDLDGDDLKYEWKVSDESGASTQTFNEANPSVTFDKEGVFTATLTVTDPSGESSSKSVKIISGNNTPEISFEITGNKTFFFPGKPFQYDVKLTDVEDGSLADGKITPDHVSVSIQYVSEGFDWAEVIQNQRSVNMSTGLNVAQALMAKNNCTSCHNLDQASIGPALVKISEKYKNTPSEWERLNNKIRHGGSGVWGEAAMPANPGVSISDANTILNYIMHVTDETSKSLPVKGTFNAIVPDGDNGRGSYILQAGYTDKGAGTAPAQTVESLVRLRNPLVPAGDADELKGAEFVVDGRGGHAIVKPLNGTSLGFKGLDMTGIKTLRIDGNATEREKNTGATIEVRLGSATGDLIGQGTMNLFIAPEIQILTEEQALQDAGGNKAAADKLRAESIAAFRAASRPSDVIIKLNQTLSGPQDIYFVFKNAEAKDSQFLMTLNGIEFKAE